jgi:hypothetical protein
MSVRCGGWKELILRVGAYEVVVMKILPWLWARSKKIVQEQQFSLPV